MYEWHGFDLKINSPKNVIDTSHPQRNLILQKKLTLPPAALVQFKRKQGALL